MNQNGNNSYINNRIFDLEGEIKSKEEEVQKLKEAAEKAERDLVYSKLLLDELREVRKNIAISR